MSPIGWCGWNRAGPRRSGRPRCSRRTRCAPRAWERRWRWCGGPAASPGPTRSPSTTRCDCGGTGDQRAKARAGVVRVRRRHGAGRGLVRARPGRAGGAARPQRCGQIDARAARDRSAPALDRALRARVAGALLERAAAGAALLVVTHDLAFAAETLERALVLDRGRLACDEPLAGLLAAPPRLEPLGLAPPAVAALSRA